MRKLFDVLAGICGILFFIFAMAVDSTSNVPIIICLGTSIYLAIYVKGVMTYAMDKKW